MSTDYPNALKPIFMLAALCSCSLLVAAERYEPLPTLKASQILAPELVAGPNHRVAESVRNDGYMNHFSVQSRFGAFSADSNAELRLRVAEVNAIAAMSEAERSREFLDSAQQAGENVFKGASQLLTDPVNTLSGAVSGIGKLFKRAGKSFSGDAPSQREDSRWKDLIGFSKAKRQLAAEFGVDPYSDNPVLQEHLDDLAWTSYAGGLSISAVTAFIPGGAGLAVSTVRTSDMMNDIYRTESPSELRELNRQKLATLQVEPQLIDLFIRNSVFSPTQQTLLVGALAEMTGTANQSEFVRFAVLTQTVDVARFRQRQARMYAGYHRTVQPIRRFVAVGELAAGLDQQNRLVFAVPLDYLVWSENMARFVDGANRQVDQLAGITGKALWVTGGLSPLARQALERRGWQIHPQAGKPLLGE